MNTHNEDAVPGWILVIFAILFLVAISSCGPIPNIPETRQAQRDTVIVEECDPVYVTDPEKQKSAVDSLESELQEMKLTIRIASLHSVNPYLARPVVRAALKHGLDPYVFARLVDTESDWIPLAVGRAGEIGLTQVKLSTARIYVPGIEPRHLRDPFISAEVGAWYLAKQVEAHDGDLFNALRAYNAGPSTAKSNSRISRRYASRILQEGENNGD